MGVEFFDFVLSRRAGCGGSGDFDFDERFGKDFGVDFELIGRRVLASSLRVGVDGEEGTSGSDGGNEGAGSAFVPFEVAG